MPPLLLASMVTCTHNHLSIPHHQSLLSLPKTFYRTASVPCMVTLYEHMLSTFSLPDSSSKPLPLGLLPSTSPWWQATPTSTTRTSRIHLQVLECAFHDVVLSPILFLFRSTTTAFFSANSKEKARHRATNPSNKQSRNAPEHKYPQ